MMPFVVHKSQWDVRRFHDKPVVVYLEYKARFLSVANQDEMLTIWYQKDLTNLEVSKLTIYALLTGELANFDTEVFKFRGTVAFNDGQFVMHVYIKES
jgi:hypothetical protein